MGRIRTIKPEFFKHEDLFDAEQETGLPLRLAFVGLWTQCDREGRFAWRPRQLKVDIMPWDEVDFSRVLDALAARGFILNYASAGREFGCIPSWHRHQVINNREKASQLPEPTEMMDISDASCTRASRMDDACLTPGEGKGKERKGKEYILPETSSGTAAGKSRKLAYPESFERFWSIYPTTPNMGKKEAFKEWKNLTAEEQEKCIRAVPGYVAFLKTKPRLETLHANSFISTGRFEGYTSSDTTSPTEDREKWATRLRCGRTQQKWSTRDWGPRPFEDGCKVPIDLLEKGDGEGWGEMELRAA